MHPDQRSESCSVVSNSLRPHGLYSPWNSPGRNTGVGSLFLLHRIFPAQGLNPGLPHCRRILYQLSHKGSPRILEWVVYRFSSGASWLRNPTRVSCIASRFFTNELSGKPLVHFFKMLIRKTIVNWSSTLSKLKKYSHWFFNLSRKIDCVSMPEQVSNKPSYHQWLISK